MSALSEVDLLILRVQACTLRLRRTDPVPSGELNALADAARAQAQVADAPSRARLAEAIREITEALAEAQEGIEARMLQLRKGRRAVHRYQAAAGR